MEIGVITCPKLLSPHTNQKMNKKDGQVTRRTINPAIPI